MRTNRMIAAAALLFLANIGTSAHAASRSVTLVLEGMYCAMCPVTVKTALDFSDGVDEVKVGRDPDEAVIRYDDAKTSPAKLIEVVKKSGYGAHVKPARAKP